MDPRTIAGALAALYASAVAAGGYATDVVTGERGTAVGVALLIGAVATAAGTLLYRTSQAWARTNAQAMELLAVERTEHAHTRERAERAEAKADAAEARALRTEGRLRAAEAELVRIRAMLEDLDDSG